MVYPGCCGAELTAIGSIERRRHENRRVRCAVAVGFVSAVAIPASAYADLIHVGIHRHGSEGIHSPSRRPERLPDL
jgi:hypothetical protein